MKIGSFKATKKAAPRFEVSDAALTNNERTRRQLTLTWGVYSEIMPTCTTLDRLIHRSMQVLKQQRIVQNGDTIVLVAGHPVQQATGANMVKLHKIT